MKRYLKNIILFIRVFWPNLFSFKFFFVDRILHSTLSRSLPTYNSQQFFI